jgi:hypothetical protein
VHAHSYEPMKPKRMEFVYPAGGSPEEVDWLGAKAQVDAAKAAGVKKVVFVGSMGGTQVRTQSTVHLLEDGTGPSRTAGVYTGGRRGVEPGS